MVAVWAKRERQNKDNKLHHTKGRIILLCTVLSGKRSPIKAAVTIISVALNTSIKYHSVNM